MMECVREGVDWDKYDIVIVGTASIVYGVYNKVVWEFVETFRAQPDAKPNSFFNVTVVARTPLKLRPKATATCRTSSSALRGNPATSSALRARSTTRTGRGTSV